MFCERRLHEKSSCITNAESATSDYTTVTDMLHMTAVTKCMKYSPTLENGNRPASQIPSHLLTANKS